MSGNLVVEAPHPLGLHFHKSHLSVGTAGTVAALQGTLICLGKLHEVLLMLLLCGFLQHPISLD